MSAKRGQIPSPEALAADKAQAFQLFSVSRETEQRLDQCVQTLLRWQANTNLIAPSTVMTVWTRHVADSLQLLPLAPPDAKIFLDLGSGGGFPALPLGCALAERPGAHVHLVESNTKKAAYLREAIREAGLPATVHAERIEDFATKFSRPADVVTARALAPLPQLLELAAPFLRPGVVGLFPKGQDVGVELAEASKGWTLSYDLAPSTTGAAGQIVIVRSLQRAA